MWLITYRTKDMRWAIRPLSCMVESGAYGVHEVDEVRAYMVGRQRILDYIKKKQDALMKEEVRAGEDVLRLLGELVSILWVKIPPAQNNHNT